MKILILLLIGPLELLQKKLSRVLIYDATIATVVDLLKKMTDKKFKNLFNYYNTQEI